MSAAAEVGSPLDSTMKLIILVPCLNEADHSAPRLRAHAPPDPGNRRHRVPRRRRRVTATTPWRWPADWASSTSCTMSATWASASRSTTATLKALEMGADIVVNTDGDNQYPERADPRPDPTDPGRPGGHRHRRSSDRTPSSTSPRSRSAAAPGQPGRQRRSRHRVAGRRQRVPGLLHGKRCCGSTP